MKLAMCHYRLHRRWQDEGRDIDRLTDEVHALGIDGSVDRGDPPAVAAGLERVLRALQSLGPEPEATGVPRSVEYTKVVSGAL